MNEFVLSLGVITTFVLLAGGILLIRRGDRLRGALMIVAALVLFGNVILLSAPLPATRPGATTTDMQ